MASAYNPRETVKIALVILHADAARGGAERYTLDLAAALVKRGHEVSILASSFQDQPFVGSAVKIPTPDHGTRTARYNAFISSLPCELGRHRFDVVHAMLPVTACDLYHPHAGIAVEAVLSGHLNKSGVIRQALAWVGTRTNRRRLKFAQVEREMLTGDSMSKPMVLCLSNLIKGLVHRRYPALHAEQLVSLFNGIDLARFDPDQNPQDRTEIREKYHFAEGAIVGLMLAQDFERKGLKQAIAALSKINDPRMLLLIGGKGAPSSYRRLARVLGVSDRVVFAGPVSNPAAFYRAADFFVLPTRFDPCSLVVLEALAMGLPVISTSKNGACEIMQDGVHGRVLQEAEDLPGLTAAMMEMAGTEARGRMSAHCLSLRPNLSQEAHLDRLELLYKRVLAAKG